MTKQRKSVLVVDDDVELVTMVEIVLDAAGYRVITAREGQEALEKVAEEMPDMSLLDMKMPGMDGWEFARDFHAKHDDLAPIVVFTAAEDARKRAEEIDAVGYLGKPFDINELVKIVERHAGSPI